MVVSLLAAAASAWGVLMGLSPVLQIRRMLRARSSREVSLGYFSILLAGFLLWISYGIAAGNLVLIIPNTIALLAARNDGVGAQLVIDNLTAGSLTNVGVTASDLTGPGVVDHNVEVTSFCKRGIECLLDGKSISKIETHRMASRHFGDPFQIARCAPDLVIMRHK